MQFFVLYPKYPFSANLAQKYQNCQFKLKFEYINMYLIYLKITEYLVPVLISYSLIIYSQLRFLYTTDSIYLPRFRK